MVVFPGPCRQVAKVLIIDQLTDLVLLAEGFLGLADLWQICCSDSALHRRHMKEGEWRCGAMATKLAHHHWLNKIIR